MNIDINKYSLEALPNILEHDLTQYITLEKHLITLENYSVMARDGNLYGNNLKDCQNICAIYTPQISTESYTVSTESLLTIILGTIAAVIIAIVAFIARAIQIGKRINDDGISTADYEEATKRLGKGVGLFDSEALRVAKDIAKARREINVLDISKMSLKEIVSAINKVSSDSPKEVEDLIMLFVTIRDQLNLKFNKPYTINELLSWCEVLERKSIADGIMDLVKVSGNSVGSGSILSLEALTIDPSATAMAIEEGAVKISAAKKAHQHILNDKTAYNQRVKEFDEMNQVLKTDLPTNYIVKRGDKSNHIDLLVKGLSEHDWHRLHQKLENELRDLAKIDNKSAVQQYIKPYTDVLEKLAGYEKIDEKRVSDDVKRIVHEIPRQAGRLMSEYTKFILIIHRYKRFIVKTNGVLDKLK